MPTPRAVHRTGYGVWTLYLCTYVLVHLYTCILAHVKNTYISIYLHMLRILIYLLMNEFSFTYAADFSIAVSFNKVLRYSVDVYQTKHAIG